MDKKSGNMLEKHTTLFLLDDIIADSNLNQKRRHRNHSLWFLTQSYAAIPKNIRRQAKMLYVWYPKDRNDLKTIHEENDVIESPQEMDKIKNKLKNGKYTCLVMRIEHPREHEICC